MHCGVLVLKDQPLRWQRGLLGRRKEGNPERVWAGGRMVCSAGPRGLCRAGGHGRFFEEKNETITFLLRERKTLGVHLLVLSEVLD